MKNRRRPRALSLTLPDTLQPYFVFGGERYLMRNVSEQGIGLWVPQEKAFGLTPKTKVNGDIVINNQIHPVTLEVVHSTKGYVGLKILKADRELTQIFESILEPSQYAARLVAEPGNGVEDPDTGLLTFTYRGGPQVKLSFWVGPGREIKAVEIHLLDRWVRRNQFAPIQTGILPDSNELVLVVHDQPNPEFTQAATQFLGSVPPPIPSALLWHFMESGEIVHVHESLLKQTA
ncbi:MAG: hypothetical protein HYR96_01995 [Deltaproteobacteria bacterium]|nr:hypothetical protein [Deltaproteobacteria bacterium]MBI3295641.1 hypothetical protein [Deltaproteobacteria bacterium]